MLNRFLAAVVLALCAFSQAQAEPPLVFIVSGQSNAVGYGRTSELTDIQMKMPGNVEFYRKGVKKMFSDIVYFGPEITFSQAVAKQYPDRTIIISKFGENWTSIEEWIPGSENYSLLLQYAALAVNGREVEYAGLLWMQGETDAKRSDRAYAYEGRLQLLIDGIRTDLSSPDMKVLIGEINPPGDYDYASRVIMAQMKIAGKNQNVRLVPTYRLAKLPDKLHYSSKGLLNLGKRFAEVMSY